MITAARFKAISDSCGLAAGTFRSFACLAAALSIYCLSDISVTASDPHQSISKSEYHRNRGTEVARPPGKPNIETSQLCGDDHRVIANDYEKLRVVKLTAKFGEIVKRGTGFIVSDKCVITAAHNIFSYERQSFADSVSVTFNGHGQQAVELKTVQGYIDSESSECDYGSVELAHAIEGCRLMPYGDDELPGSAKISGFPSQNSSQSLTKTDQVPSDTSTSPNRQKTGQLLSDSGIIRERTGLLLSLEGAESTTGQSGSPVFRPDGVAIAIHTGGRCEATKPISESVRIIGPIKSNIQNWSQ
jgi:V8-like Glu-specific endopeptidase